MLARADEDMRGRLRRDVFEGEKFRIFIHQFRRQFAFADLAKDAVIHRPPASRKITSRKASDSSLANKVHR
jgi:hypothetical protein